MGMRHREIRISGSTSAHNSERDEIDEAAWQELVKAVEEVCDRRQFRALGIQVDET